jgi:hypothetical protein
MARLSSLGSGVTLHCTAQVLLPDQTGSDQLHCEVVQQHPKVCMCAYVVMRVGLSALHCVCPVLHHDLRNVLGLASCQRC